MSQQVRRRTQKTLTYAANGKSSESLSRGMVYREIYLRLRGQLTVAGVNNTAAKTLRGDEWAAVKRIDLIVNNTDVIKSISGDALWWLNYFMLGQAPDVSNAIGDGATLNPTFDSILILPLWMPGTIRPMDTALDASKLADLKIEVTWGTHASINADATALTAAIDVASLESFGVEGVFSQWRVFPIEREVTATNSQFLVELPVGEMYRGFMINTSDAGVDSGAVINNFKLRSGQTVFADMAEEYLARLHRQRTGVNLGFSGTAYDDLRKGDASKLAGWYFYDHVTDGFLSEAIDSLGFSELTLEFDVTVGGGTTKLTVIPMQIRPVRGRG